MMTTTVEHCFSNKFHIKYNLKRLTHAKVWTRDDILTQWASSFVYDCMLIITLFYVWFQLTSIKFCSVSINTQNKKCLASANVFWYGLQIITHTNQLLAFTTFDQIRNKTQRQARNNLVSISVSNLSRKVTFVNSTHINSWWQMLNITTYRAIFRCDTYAHFPTHYITNV